jgi:hypothetical protein
MSHPAVTAPIIGARNLSQLADSLAALDVAMTAGLRAEISALSVTPAPATDRTETLKDLESYTPTGYPSVIVGQPRRYPPQLTHDHTEPPVSGAVSYLNGGNVCHALAPGPAPDRF